MLFFFRQETKTMERPESVLIGLQTPNTLPDLAIVDLKQNERDPAYDFCNEIAQILRKKFTSHRELKSLISQIIIAERIDQLMDLILEFYNCVMINHIIKTQLKNVYEIYRFGIIERSSLVEKCIEEFSKIPSDLKLNDTLLKELISVFRLVEEPVFVELIRILYKSGIMRDLYITAYGISYQPGVFEKEDPQDETAILKCSQYLLFCYKNIIAALESIYKSKDLKEAGEYEILSAEKFQLNSDIPLDKIKIENITAHPKLVSFLEREFPILKRLDKEPNLTIKKSSIAYVEKTKRILNQLIHSKKSELLHYSPIQGQYSKKVLSMTDHLIKNNQTENIDLENGSDLINAKIVISKRRSKTKCEVLLKHEKAAAFARQGVIIIEVIDDVGGLDASLLKFLRLYEGSLASYIPQRIWVQLAFAGLSVYFTNKAISDPNDVTRPTRIYKAIMKGAVFLTFSLNIAIQIFKEFNPNVRYISNTDFWVKVALTPLIFSLENILWNVFTPLEKELCCRSRVCGHRGKLIGDVTNDSFYNAGVIFAFTNTFFRLPTGLGNQIVFILLPGFITALAQHFSPAREKVNLVIRYLIGTIFSFTFARSEYPSSPEHQLEQGWQSYVRLGLGLGLSFYSIYVIIKTWRQFSEDYINEETKAEIIIKNIRMHVTKDSVDFPYVEGLLLTDAEYMTLKTDMEEGREDQALKRIEESSRSLIFSDTFDRKENIRLSLLGKTKGEAFSERSFNEFDGSLHPGLKSDSDLDQDSDDESVLEEPANPPLNGEGRPQVSRSRSNFCGSCSSWCTIS